MLALKPIGSDANPLARLCGGARDSRAVYDDAERVKPAAGCQGRLVESAALMLRSTPGNKNTQNTLKRLGVNHIPGIEEVNFFRDDGSVIHFKNPKSVQASIGANTYVISGTAENKKLQDLLPGIINQLGSDNLEHLKTIAGSFQGGGAGAGGDDDDDDEDVPDLEEDFEAASKT